MLGKQMPREAKSAGLLTSSRCFENPVWWDLAQGFRQTQVFPPYSGVFNLTHLLKIDRYTYIMQSILRGNSISESQTTPSCIS